MNKLIEFPKFEENKPQNHIEKIFSFIKNKSFDTSKELITTDEKDVDLKTDVIYPEDVYISTLKFNDQFLKDVGLDEIYKDYLYDLLRVRFSFERKSREEFVNVNTRSMQNVQIPSEFKNIEEARK